jgi:hypothetical protein
MKPLAVCVLDAGGHLIAGEREDGTSAGRFEVARGKAHGAVMMGLPGSAQQARAEQQPFFIGAMNGLFGGQVVPVKGGVLIRDGRGTLIGPIGATFALFYLTSALGGQSVLNNNLVLGVILIVFVLLVPKGVAPTVIDFVNARRKKAPVRARRRRRDLGRSPRRPTRQRRP